jgi:hypothetical protein
MSRLQYTKVRGQSSNPTARRIIEGMVVAGPAPHMMLQTVEDMSVEQVVERVATESVRAGRVRVEIGQQYFLAASKTAHRFYLVAQLVSGEWVCSYDGSNPKFINIVKRFIASVNDVA